MSADLVVALRSLLVLIEVEVRLRTSTLPAVASWAGATLEPSTGSGSEGPLTPDEVRTVRVARAVVRRWPFAPGPCLREALVIAALLDAPRRPVLRLGVRRIDGRPVGHAWLEMGAVTVGESADGKFSFPKTVSTLP